MFYAGDARGYVYAFDGPTGALRWRYKSDTVTTAGIAYADGALYLGQGVVLNGPRGAVTRLDAATGDVVWTAENSSPLWTPPLVDGDAVVVVGDSLYRFDRETGAKQTLADTPGVSEPPTLHDGWVYGSAAGPWKQHARTGELAWSVRYVSGGGYNEAVVGDRVYHAAGGVGVFDDATGRLLHEEPSRGGYVWWVRSGAGLVVAQATYRLTAYRPGRIDAVSDDQP